MIIRHARQDEAELLAEKLAGFHDSALGRMLGEYDAKAGADLILRTTQTDDAVTLVADDEGEIFGVLCAGAFSHPFKPSMKMAQELFWWVDPEKRKSGVGGALLDAAEKWAADVGCAVMIFETIHGIDHERNGAFYERSGYDVLQHSYFKVI